MDKYGIYNKKRWKYLRIKILSEHPICEMCERNIATLVDHIKPISEGGDPWSEDNLQALCWRCHSAKTASEDGGFKNRKVKGRIKGCTPDGFPLDVKSEWRAFK